MKYTNIRAFEKHLNEAGPAHFSPVYFIIGKDPYEKKEAESILINALLGTTMSREHALQTLDGEKADSAILQAELSSMSFFAAARIVCVRNADKLNKAATASLENYFASPAKATFLILIAETVNRATNFYKKGEKAGIILDLQEEKPWEKENSLAQKVMEWARKSDKNIDPQAAQYLIQHAGADQFLLSHEVEKLICYAGEQQHITVADVQAVCTGGGTESIWQLGDAIFKKDGSSALKIMNSQLREGSAFFSLVRQIRAQFQNKLQIASLLEAGGGPEDVQKLFPYMRGQILQQNIRTATDYGSANLRKGILAIDATELLAKNSSVDSDLLADKLMIQLTT